MSTDMTRLINSTSSENSEKLGERLAANFRGGEVIELISDLGGGKTTFVHGLAKAIGSTDKVASPTFTISKVYKSEKLEIHHFDFYRLPDAGLMEHELHDVLGDPKIIVVVEWGDVVQHVLPKERLTIKITKTDEQSRQFELTCPSPLQYLLENI